MWKISKEQVCILFVGVCWSFDKPELRVSHEGCHSCQPDS